MKVLIDTNILLDVLMNRSPFVEDSLEVWKLCETGMVSGCVSALSLANLVYIMRKQLDPAVVHEILSGLNLVFEFVDLSSDIIQKASRMEWTDFEDAVQSVTAKQNHCEYMITRNTKDFADSEVLAMTPRTWVTQVFLAEK